LAAVRALELPRALARRFGNNVTEKSIKCSTILRQIVTTNMKLGEALTSAHIEIPEIPARSKITAPTGQADRIVLVVNFSVFILQA